MDEMMMSEGAGPVGVEDPLARDSAADAAVATTRRGLCRVAVIAAETASRFVREGVPLDPVAWMLTPRRLFGGAAALDACLSREPFRRALLLHGLSLGLDADPGELDTARSVGGAAAPPILAGAGTGSRRAALDLIEPGACADRLYSAVLWTDGAHSRLEAFHASFSPSMDIFARRVALRFGLMFAPAADIREGVDAGSPKVRALVAPDTLASLLAAAAGIAGHARLDVTVSRRSGSGA